MTFYRGLCEDVLDTLGRDDALRHAYRVYLWRRTLRFLNRSRPDIGQAADAEFYSEIQAFRLSRMCYELDAERGRRM
jgi:hypothetical protein